MKQVLDGAVAGAVRHMDMLHRLIDSVALLDMLHAFAVAIDGADGKCDARCTRMHACLSVGCIL